MSRLSHLIMIVSYVLGVVSVVIVILIAFVPQFAGRVHLTTRGGLIFACTLFLCAVSSYLVRTSAQPKS